MTHYQVLEDHHRGDFSVVTASGKGARLACLLPLFCLISVCRDTPAGRNERRTQVDLYISGQSSLVSLEEYRSRDLLMFPLTLIELLMSGRSIKKATSAGI